MTLHKDWKKIANRAWSFRLILLAGSLSGCEVVLPYYSDSIPRNTFAILSLVVSVLALGSRLIAQKNYEDTNER